MTVGEGDTMVGLPQYFFSWGFS